MALHEFAVKECSARNSVGWGYNVTCLTPSITMLMESARVVQRLHTTYLRSGKSQKLRSGLWFPSFCFLFTSGICFQSQYDLAYVHNIIEAQPTDPNLSI